MATILDLAHKFQCPECSAPEGLHCVVLPAMAHTHGTAHAKRLKLGKQLRDASRANKH